MAEKIFNPENSVGIQVLNYSSVDAGASALDLEDAFLKETSWGFNQSVPFELVASPPDDEGMVVFPGDSSTNSSQIDDS